jgi:hypothetical protein
MAGAPPETPEPIWKLGPVSVKRTTDILALVAFILSIIGLLAQAKDYLRGAHVVFFPPEQVTFGSSKAFKIYSQTNEQFLLLSAIMSYVNDAPAGFNAAVGREYLRFYVGGKKYQYVAHQTVNTNTELNASGVSILTASKKEDSGPFAISSGSAISHEVLFEPTHMVRCATRDKECSGSLSTIKWGDFKSAVQKDPNVRVTLVADVFGQDTLTVDCLIKMSNYDLVAFDTPEQEWGAPNCEEKKNPSFWRDFWERIFGAPSNSPQQIR